MPTKVTKEFTFDSAHQLVGHKSKCKNVHGHTYKLAVTVEGEPITVSGTDDGFVMDFADLKEIVKSNIVDPMDHAFISSGNEPILPVLNNTGSKVYLLPNLRSTCENLAAWIFKVIDDKLKDYTKHYSDERSCMQLVSVKLWETPTSFAEVGQD